MADEIFPSTATLEGLGGSTDLGTGVYYPAKGEGPDWYESFAKCIYRLMKNASVASGLRVFKDGDATFGVKVGSFFDGNTLRQVTAVETHALTDNATNSIYLLADGTLTISTTGFPDSSATPHLRLATITIAGGAYDDDDIVDYRGSHLFQLAGDVSNIADLAVGSDQLSVAVASQLPQIEFTVNGQSGSSNTVSLQVQDAQGNSVAERFLIEVWLSDSSYGSPTLDPPDTAASWVTGTTIEEITTDIRWQIVTNSSGQAMLSLSESGSDSWYLNASINGRMMCSSVIAIS